MKFLVFLLLVFISNEFSAQSDSIYSKLSAIQIDSVFTDSIRKEFNIKFPFYKVYTFEDREGKHLLALTESSFQGDKHANNDSIQAFHFLFKNNLLELKWSFVDFKIGNPTHYIDENSIWFWTKYISLKDIDKDGLIDPIIIFGTSSESNSMEDGRIKILCFYKGQKYGIRHQNSLYDNDRFSKVDAKFYQLPISIQSHVKQIMEKMDENAVSNFPAGWQKSMKTKKLYIDESY